MTNEDKIYEYDGKYYSNTDHSLEVDEGKWGGNLYDLFFEASHGSDSFLSEQTVYYSDCNPENVYEDSDELVAEFFDDSEVSLEDIRKGRFRDDDE